MQTASDSVVKDEMWHELGWQGGPLRSLCSDRKESASQHQRKNSQMDLPSSPGSPRPRPRAKDISKKSKSRTVKPPLYYRGFPSQDRTGRGHHNGETSRWLLLSWPQCPQASSGWGQRSDPAFWETWLLPHLPHSSVPRVSGQVRYGYRYLLDGNDLRSILEKYSSLVFQYCLNIQTLITYYFIISAFT